MQASRLIASELNAMNHELHSLVDWMQPADWLRRGAPGTNLPAFTFWHIPRVLDSTVQTGIRGVPELIGSEPWASKAWVRPEAGTGYSMQEADELAAQVVPEEVLAYADALRSLTSQWLRQLSDEELEAPNLLMDHTMAVPAYHRPAVREAIVPLDRQPVWLLLTLTCFAHSWAHIQEIRLLVGTARNSD